MAIQRGLGVVYSIGSIVFTAGIANSSGTLSNIQSLNVSREAEMTELKKNGKVVSQVFHGFAKRLSMTIIPCAASIAAAKASAEAHMTDAENAAVSIVGARLTITDDLGSIIDDTYNVISATENRTVDGVVTIDLECEASDESQDITTKIT